MKTLIKYAIVIAMSLGLVMALSPSVGALDPFEEACEGNSDSAICEESRSGMSVGELIAQVTKVLMMFVGAIAVIMIVYGGLRFSASGGSPESIKTAKNTIMYAVVGLVIAIAGYAIVSFVATQLT